MPEVIHHTNWNMRIQRIVAHTFPIEAHWCMNSKQEAMRARICRTDRIKRNIAGLPVSVQDEVLSQAEQKLGIEKYKR